MNRRAAATISLVALVLLAAGCGNGAKSPAVASIGSSPSRQTSATSSSPASGGGDGQPSSPATMTKLLAFSGCMRADGEPTFPDPLAGGGYPRTGPSGLDQLDPKSPQFVAAENACRSDAVAAGVIHTPGQQKLHIQQLDAEDACIRKHGVPDMPDANANGVQTLAPQGVSAARMQSAERACAYLNP